jgi:hypothetical protein
MDDDTYENLGFRKPTEKELMSMRFLYESQKRLDRMKIAFLHEYGSDREILKEFNLRWNSWSFAIKDHLAKAVYEAVSLEEYLIHYLTE